MVGGGGTTNGGGDGGGGGGGGDGGGLESGGGRGGSATEQSKSVGARTSKVVPGRTRAEKEKEVGAPVASGATASTNVIAWCSVAAGIDAGIVATGPATVAPRTAVIVTLVCRVKFAWTRAPGTHASTRTRAAKFGRGGHAREDEGDEA